MKLTELADVWPILLEAGVDKFVLSKARQGCKPQGSTAYKKIVLEAKLAGFQASQYTATQVFHLNLKQEELGAYLKEQAEFFQQLNAWSKTEEHIVLFSKTQGQQGVRYQVKALATQRPVTVTAHNRSKNYLLPEGECIPALVDMGIFSQEGKVLSSMYDKYRQINRFLELVDDVLKTEQGKGNKCLRLLDFGCGKSYLTFVLYHYLRVLKGLEVEIIGLDLKAEVIAKCNAAAQRYGYEGLRFELGDIKDYKAPFAVDMVLCLHACDTATDMALFQALQWGCKYILAVPCCQHELNAQINSTDLAICTRYGLLKERLAALYTDAIRANLLSYAGYKTQVLEFIELEHTPKNVLLRAQRLGKPKPAAAAQALQEVQALCQQFNLQPTLYQLMQAAGYF